MRLLKQLTYGILFILIPVGIVSGIYIFKSFEAPTCFDSIRNQNEVDVDCGGECTECETKDAKLNIEDSVFFKAGDGQVTLVNNIENPINRGALFEYNINLFGSFGGVIQSIEGASSIEPSGQRYIVLPGINIDRADIERAELEVTRIKWNDDSKLRTLLLEQSGTQTVLENNQAKIVGNLTNISNEIVETARITALLFDEDGKIVNASSAELKNISVLDKTPFTIFLPLEGASSSQAPIRTRIFSEIIPEL